MPSGTYRQVFLLFNYAIKIPHLKNFLAGLRCNQWEREMWFKWRPIFQWPNLCPIKFADPFGLIVVMFRAEQPVSSDEAHEAFLDYYPNINAETKSDNFGRIGNKVYILDYGIATYSDIKAQRVYYQNHPYKPAINLDDSIN